MAASCVTDVYRIGAAMPLQETVAPTNSQGLRNLDDLAVRRYLSSFPRALIYAGLGENDRAGMSGTGVSGALYRK